MSISHNCFRSNRPALKLTREVLSSALLEAIAADLLAQGMMGSHADLAIFIKRVSRPQPADIAGTGGAFDA